jgi:hypothetical protein
LIILININEKKNLRRRRRRRRRRKKRKSLTLPVGGGPNSLPVYIVSNMYRQKAALCEKIPKRKKRRNTTHNPVRDGRGCKRRRWQRVCKSPERIDIYNNKEKAEKKKTPEVQSPINQVQCGGRSTNGVSLSPPHHLVVMVVGLAEAPRFLLLLGNTSNGVYHRRPFCCSPHL